MASAGRCDRGFAIELAVPAGLACWFSVMALDMHGWLCAPGRDLLGTPGHGSPRGCRGAPGGLPRQGLRFGASTGDGQAGCSMRSDGRLVWRKGSVMRRLPWRQRRRLTALLLAGVLACAAALVGLVAGPTGPAMASSRHTVTVTNPGNQAGPVGTAASLQIQAAGHTLTYTATGLPAGLSISSSTGLITGTPTTAATSTVTVIVTDSTGDSGSATFTWTITPPSGPAPQLQVSGNKLVNSATSQQVVLHGVNRSGGEYSCVNGTGIWDGPMDQP